MPSTSSKNLSRFTPLPWGVAVAVLLDISRSHIRSTLSPDHSSAAAATHRPLSPHHHVKALADRFLKDGAEDLWNHRDGPLTPTPTVNLDFRPKHSRGYRSVPEVGNNRVGAHKIRFWRKGSDDSSSESESEEVELSSKVGSSASLGEYDVKRERRVVNLDPKPHGEEIVHVFFF